MFFFLKGLAMLLSLLIGASGSSAFSLHSAGGGVSSPMDGGGNMPGESSGGGGGPH